MLPHFRRRPDNLRLLPAFIAISIFMAAVKIYALLTIRTQLWLTRDVGVVDGAVQRTAGAGEGMSRAAAALRGPGRHVACAIVLGILAPVGLLGLPGAQASTLASAATPLPFVLQRSIVLNAKQIVLVNSHTIVRVIPFSGTRTGNPAADRRRGSGPLAWIAHPSRGRSCCWPPWCKPGVLLVRAIPGGQHRSSGNRPRRFLGGEAATATFGRRDSFLLEPGSRAPVTAATPGRPFLLYQNGSRMHLVDSTFQYLGSNVDGGSGVTWRNDGNGGDATHTTFIGNYTGAHVTSRPNISLTADSFAHNAQLGVSLSATSLRP